MNDQNNNDVLIKDFNSLTINQKNSISNIKNEFFYHILNWNSKWLEDEKYKNIDPEIIDDIKMSSAKLKYTNIEEYQNIMFPMLIHEFWSILKRDSEKYVQEKKKVPVNASKLCGMPTETISIDNNKDYKIYSFYLTAISDPSQNYPSCGELIKLQFIDSGQSTEVFGYIEDLETRTDRKTPKSNRTLTYKILTNMPMKNYEASIFSITSVSFIFCHLILIDALEGLTKLPLCESILCPNTESYSMSECMEFNSSDIVTKHNLNSIQLDVVKGVIGMVEQRKPGICLIQGPPGTGKSKTIVNIIATILKRNNANKILVCAPSNKAIDSVVLQLLKVQSTLESEGISLRIVRVGNEDRMDETVKSLSLSRQAELNVTNTRGNFFTRKQEILKRAHVIASTLASCYMNKVMRSVFGMHSSMRSQPTVCIVDEAAQATELLTLMPLLLGIEQLVLVGDPQQLPPTILSQKAKYNGYGMSLFSRAQNIFKGNIVNPIMMLNTQYRMKDSISEWPNFYFYKGALKNAASINPLRICNYKLFNHEFPQDEDGHANQKEAELVIKSVQLLLKKFNLDIANDKISIGIITPYHKQRELICTMLSASLLKTEKIEVNTVDSYQGSEKDIIIMSCVRSDGIGFMKNPNRLCVSLTRAKHSMIMFGNFEAFKNNKMWRRLIDDAQYRSVFTNIGHTNARSVLRKHVLLYNTAMFAKKTVFNDITKYRNVLTNTENKLVLIDDTKHQNLCINILDISIVSMLRNFNCIHVDHVNAEFTLILDDIIAPTSITIFSVVVEYCYDFTNIEGINQNVASKTISLPASAMSLNNEFSTNLHHATQSSSAGCFGLTRKHIRRIFQFFNCRRVEDKPSNRLKERRKTI